MAALGDLLKLNQGRADFGFELFEEGIVVDTDASKEPRNAGGGYVSNEGYWRWWMYGGRAARQPIDFVEGDTVVDWWSL